MATETNPPKTTRDSYAVPAELSKGSFFGALNCKSISDDDLCATCSKCKYAPGELSVCSENFPGQQDADGYVQRCDAFAEIPAKGLQS